MIGICRTLAMVILVAIGMAILIIKGFPPPDEFTLMKKKDRVNLIAGFGLIILGLLIGAL